MKNFFPFLYLLVVLLLLSLAGNTQNIGINNPAPAASALLDLSSTNKGFLAPRMTTAQRLLIPAPANGLLVYDLSIAQFFYFDGSVWKAMGDGSSGWLTTGNAGTSPSVHFVGTIDAANLAFKVNNIHAGIIEESMTGSTKIGFRSGINNLFSSSSANVMIGAGAGENLNGGNNVMVGNEAGKTITFGQNNTIIGFKANLSGSNVSEATIVGSEAGLVNNSNEASFFGRDAGRENGNGTSNSYFGYKAGRNVIGNNNTAFGDRVLLQANSANRNAAFGSEALSDFDNGNDNAVFGNHSAHELSSGNSNSVFGSNAGQGINNASFNSIFGMEAGGLMFSVSYDGNAFFGYRAGASSQTGFNAFFGTEAGFSNIQGFANSFFGTRSGFSLDEGFNNAFFGDSTGLVLGQSSFSNFNNNNTFVGSKAGRFYQEGSDNTLIGAQTGTSNEGSFNTYVGAQAGSGVFGFDNILHTTAVGYRAGFNNRKNNNTFLGSASGFNAEGTGLTFIGSNTGLEVEGSDNVFVGDSIAVLLEQPGEFNTFIGSKAASKMDHGSENTAVGYQAMSALFNPGNNAFNVTAIGAFAGQELQQANNSTFVGHKAGQFQFTGGDNVYIGTQSGMNNQNSSQNTAIGMLAAAQADNSSSNVTVGYSAGLNLDNSSNNVYIGNQAGENSSSANKNVLIGSNVFSSVNNLQESIAIGELAGNLSNNGTGITLIGKSSQAISNNNATAIGHRAHVTTDNSLVLGSVSGENGALSSVNVGVGTSAPASRLHIVGSLRIEDGTQAAGRVLTTDALGNASWQANSGGSDNWELAGNAGTIDGVNFIGTTDNVPFNIRVNNEKAGRIEINALTANTYYGFQAGNAININGQHNALFGYKAGVANVGSHNCFFGNEAGLANTSGQRNTFMGCQAGDLTNIGNQNCFYGNQSGALNTSGSNNSYFGFNAGGNAIGTLNTSIGSNAISGGSRSTVLGAGAIIQGSLVNATAIGSLSRADVSNSIVLGSVNGINGGTATVNVGIGTTAPARRLHVVNTGISGGVFNPNAAVAIESNTSTFLHMLTPTANENGLLFGNLSGSIRSGILFNSAAADGLDFRTGGNSARMVITSTGNIGIATTVPTQRLDVNGNIAGEDYIASVSNGVINCGGGVLNTLINMISDVVITPLNVNGDEDLYIQDDLELGGQGFKPGGGSWAAASDKRLKRDIVPFSDGLEQVLKINPVKFKYNDHFKSLNNGKEYIGVIAQEIKEIAPYTVELTKFGEQQSEDENGIARTIKEGEEFYSYDSSALTYMLINAIKEQQEMIKKQQEQIDELKKKLN